MRARVTQDGTIYAQNSTFGYSDGANPTTGEGIQLRSPTPNMAPVRLTAPLSISCCVYLLYRLVSHAHPCKTDSLLPIHLCSGVVVFY